MLGGPFSFSFCCFKLLVWGDLATCFLDLGLWPLELLVLHLPYVDAMGGLLVLRLGFQILLLFFLVWCAFGLDAACGLALKGNHIILLRTSNLGERPLGVCFVGEKVMMNFKSRGSPGYRMQGKYGKDSLNRFHALSSPNFEDYDVCFPALCGASETPIEDMSSSASNLRGASSTPVRDYDCAEEGRRLERLTVTALNRAKKGHNPLTQEEVNHIESWLARYRASKADSPNQRGASKYLGVSASVRDLTGQVEASLKDLRPAMKIQIPAKRDLAGIALAFSVVASENESLDGADEVSKAGDKREEDEGASPKADPGSLIKNDDESVQEEVTTEEEEESTDVSGEEGSESGDEESEVVGDLGEEASPKPEQGIPSSSLPKELCLASDVANGGPVEALKGVDEVAGSDREGSEVVNNEMVVSQPNPSVSGILIPCDKSVMDLPISVAVSGVKGCNPCVDSERKIQVEACVKPFDYACKVFDKMPTSFSEVQTVRTGGPQSWADIVNKKKRGDLSNPTSRASASGSSLDFVDLSNASDPNIVEIDSEMVDDQSWASCLVGYFFFG
ncbi:hypothetical protein U1Q18_047207 [Sarracenia purpurea var. burkii]